MEDGESTYLLPKRDDENGKYCQYIQDTATVEELEGMLEKKFLEEDLKELLSASNSSCTQHPIFITLTTIALLSFFFVAHSYNDGSSHASAAASSNILKTSHPEGLSALKKEQKLAMFNALKENFGKQYASIEEEADAIKNFLSNLETIDFLNQHRGSTTGRYGVTKYFDLNYEERFSIRGYSQERDILEDQSHSTSTVVFDRVCRTCGQIPSLQSTNFDAIPTSFDWKDYGATIEVHDQEKCERSWSYAVADNVASANFFAGNKLTSLSSGQLAACIHQSNLCAADGFSDAFQHVLAFGISELDPRMDVNPYAAECTLPSPDSDVHISSWAWIEVQDEKELKQALMMNGPLVVAVQSTGLEFYEAGVDSGLNCDKSKSPDHAALLTGFGVDEDGSEFWVLKNSWGTDWGEKGEWRLAMGSNACGIMNNIASAFEN